MAIHQMVINILITAQAAMSTGGVGTMKVTANMLPASPGQHSSIQISDSGADSGDTAKALHELFEKGYIEKILEVISHFSPSKKDSGLCGRPSPYPMEKIV